MFLLIVHREAMGNSGWQSALLYTFGFLIVVLNISTALLNYTTQRPQRRTLRSYSFKGDDYPAYYPIDLGAATLTPEDTRHYHVWANESAREFGLAFPRSGGFLVLGPDKRPFGVALYHQMHASLASHSLFEANSHDY